MSTWILLRGLTRERRHWGDFPGRLARAFPDEPVLTLELPGNGELNGLASPAGIAGMVAHCRAELARQAIAPPYSLLAMSLGAMVAAAWAAGHPGEVDGCVLASASFGAFSPWHRRLRPGAWPTLLGILLGSDPVLRERRVLALTSGNPRAHVEILDDWVAIRESRPVHPSNALRQVLAAARYRPPGEAPVPTLVLLGAADRLVDPSCSREIARRWNCPLALHPEAGHDLPLDAPDWVIREILRWRPGVR